MSARDNVYIEFPIIGRLPTRKAIFVVEYVKDFSARRAAKACGRQAPWGYDMLEDEEVQTAIRNVIIHRQDESDISAEWVLKEAVDNHRIARMTGNLAASNKALSIISKHRDVDAEASSKQFSVDHTSSDGSMTPVAMTPANIKDISEQLESEV